MSKMCVLHGSASMRVEGATYGVTKLADHPSTNSIRPCPMTQPTAMGSPCCGSDVHSSASAAAFSFSVREPVLPKLSMALPPRVYASHQLPSSDQNPFWFWNEHVATS